MIVSESRDCRPPQRAIFNTLGTSALDQFVTGKKTIWRSAAATGTRPAGCVSHVTEPWWWSVTTTRKPRVPGVADVQPGLLCSSNAARGAAYWATCAKVRDLTRKLDEAPKTRDIESILSDIYFCNFSVFQSLPDSWAIDQLFPIMPIHRLNERPTRTGVLADITCDSDGKIDRFVSQRDVKKTLELHAITAQDEYYLAAFLVGAYQETLGDLHNLFGDTHVVHVRFHDDGGWWIEEIVKGDTANKVLEYMDTTSPTCTRRWPATASARSAKVA